MHIFAANVVRSCTSASKLVYFHIYSPLSSRSVFYGKIWPRYIRYSLMQCFVTSQPSGAHVMGLVFFEVWLGLTSLGSFLVIFLIVSGTKDSRFLSFRNAPGEIKNVTCSWSGKVVRQEGWVASANQMLFTFWLARAFTDDVIVPAQKKILSSRYNFVLCFTARKDNCMGVYFSAGQTASVVNANSWPAIHMKLRFCIAKVWTRNTLQRNVCIRSGSSLSRARRQISYAAIARGNTLVEFIFRLEERITLKLTLFLRIHKKLILNMNSRYNRC